MLEHDEDITLPALRDPLQNRDAEDLPGSELIEFLGFLKDELLKATEILSEETTAALEDGDPASRIRILNALKSRTGKLEAHARQELGDARSIIEGMKESEEPATIARLEGEVADASKSIGAALRALVAHFGI